MALLMFYGTECPHCHRMKPIVAKLREEGIVIEERETWHDPRNADLMAKYDKGLCGGVPFFYNTDGGAFICGATSEEKLREWAGAKKK